MERKALTTIFIFICSVCCYGQNPGKAEELVNEGTKLHDAGKYEEAIAMYNKALEADAAHPRALYEMSYTYSAMGKNDSTILLCKQLIKMNAPDDIVKNAYVSLGTAYDDIKQSDKAEDVYKEGIKKYPDFHLLYFNLGVTYLFENPIKDELAMNNFQKAVSHYPLHAGSHYWQYKLLADNNKIPAILAACMVCIAEQNTKRAADCAAFIQTTLTPDIKSDSATKNVTIYIPSSSLSKEKQNNFSTAEIGVSLMGTSSVLDDTLHLDTEEKKMSFHLQSLLNFLSYDKQNKGFYWTFYAPFFYEIKQKDYTDVLVNIILLNSQKSSVDWVAEHQSKVNEFYSWVKDFAWKTK